MIMRKTENQIENSSLLRLLRRERHTVSLASAVLLIAAPGFLLAGCHRDSANSSASSPSAAASGSAASSEETAHLISFTGQTGVELDASSARLAGITTVPVKARSLHQTVQPSGQVTATDSDTALVTARLPGRIVQALVSVGTPVHAGQLIATVDSTDLTQAEATYQAALSHLRLTASQLEQQRKLAGYGALSEQPVEDARRAYSAANAAVAGDTAQLTLDEITLKNTRQLVAMGEITHKPVEDAQNAYAQAQSALTQAKVTLHSTKSNLDRANALFQGGVYSKQQVEDAQTAYDNAVAAVDQGAVQEKLAADELRRQQQIYKQNLNGASSLQQAQSKLQQDQHTYENDLTTASVARKELARALAVHRSGIPISQALQQAEDAYQEAKVALQGAGNTLRLYGVSPGQALSELSNGHITIPVLAPMTGLVVSRNMVVGQLTDTSTPLVKIVNLDRVNVDAQVFEDELPDVAVGDPIQIRVAAFPNRVFTGRVTYVGNEVSPDTRTITVRTVIANPGWLLRPGMFATMLVGSRTASTNVAVPSAAILQDGSEQVVYVEAAPNQYLRRVVRTGPAVGDEVPILSGLAPGERVVTSGNELLQNEFSKLVNEKGTAA